MLGQLTGAVDAATTSDAALIVSELVTNSVIHADVVNDQGVNVELTRLHDRLRFSVTDAGSSHVPRLLPFDPSTPGGAGLRMVDDLCCTWGFLRHEDGATCVSCELLLDPTHRL